MSSTELDACDFCRLLKPVERTYLRPTLYKKPEDPTKAVKLYNEGNYFIIIKTCSDCGKPTT